ncbi:hypothetical protein OIO03_22515, partial [Acinetobacter baumannii]|nr:hypothetical protein [Acinetobacter baumannii]MCW1766378.1 hypothetical protein [Acinetobacter baumannii]
MAHACGACCIVLAQAPRLANGPYRVTECIHRVDGDLHGLNEIESMVSILSIGNGAGNESKRTYRFSSISCPNLRKRKHCLDIHFVFNRPLRDCTHPWPALR